MRLSTVLSECNKYEFKIIESFLDKERYADNQDDVDGDLILLSPGDFFEIQIGRVNLPFFSTNCNDNIMFVSPPELHCLTINHQLVSIDCMLTCSDSESNAKCNECASIIQAWFLLEADDIFAHTPNVRIIKHNFRLPPHIKLPIETEDIYVELLGKADIAYKERLGAGAVIYLRAAFEKITHQVGRDSGIAIHKPNGKTKPFDQVLRAVDNKCTIIPEEFTEKSYELFSKLSEITHGNSDEKTALEQYSALRRLVIGVIDNVKRQKEVIQNNKEIKSALEAIGIDIGGEAVE